MSALALPILDPDLEARLRTRMDEVEQALLGARPRARPGSSPRLRGT